MRHRSNRSMIGGEMELDLRKALAAKVARVSWPFRSCATVLSGRTGIRLALQKIGVRAGQRALLPSYLCPSVLQPFAEESLRVCFYRIGADLAIDTADLLQLADRVKPAVALFINYFGFPVGRAEAVSLAEVRRRCPVIEDCVQGSLIEWAEPAVGRIGDYVVTSFRKYLPLPDGGLVVSRRGRLRSLPGGDSAFAQYRLLGKMLRQERVRGRVGTEVESMYLKLFEAAEAQLDAKTPMADMSPVSREIFSRLSLARIATRRRRNFAALRSLFAADGRLRAIAEPLYSRLASRVSPLFFPVRIRAGQRDAIRSRLAAAGIFAPVHWDLPPAVAGARFEESVQLSKDILSLPVDQRYGVREMQELAAGLVKASKPAA